MMTLRTTLQADGARRIGRTLTAMTLAGALAFATGCDSPSDPGSDGTGTFQMSVTGSSAQSAAFFGGEAVATDQHEGSPMTGEQVESAVVLISRIYLVGDEHGEVDIFLEEDEAEWMELDLMEFHGSDLEVELFEAEVPEGEYGQLRFVVETAEVTLSGDNTFADGNTSAAMVPSGFLRVNLHGDLEIDEENDLILLADFDLSRSFAFQGPPSSPMGVIIKPVLFQEVARNEDEG